MIAIHHNSFGIALGAGAGCERIPTCRDRRPANERPIVSAAPEDFKSVLEGIVFVTPI